MLDETQEVVTETPVIETPTTSELTDDVKSKVIASLTEEDYLKFIEESETGTKVRDKLNTRFLQSYTGENGGQKRAIEKAIKETEDRLRKDTDSW